MTTTTIVFQHDGTGVVTYPSGAAHVESDARRFVELVATQRTFPYRLGAITIVREA